MNALTKELGLLFSPLSLCKLLSTRQFAFFFPFDLSVSLTFLYSPVFFILKRSHHLVGTTPRPSPSFWGLTLGKSLVPFSTRFVSHGGHPVCFVRRHWGASRFFFSKIQIVFFFSLQGAASPGVQPGWFWNPFVFSPFSFCRFFRLHGLPRGFHLSELEHLDFCPCFLLCRQQSVLSF